MIKARKHDIARLEDLSRELSKGLNTLMSDKYAIMKRSSMTSSDVFTSSYYPNDKYSKIIKEIGNELVPMFTAIKELAKLLEPEKTPMETEPYEPMDGDEVEIDIDAFQERLNHIG